MPQQIGDSFAEPGVRLRLFLSQLRFQPAMQLLHHRPAALLMKLQSLFRLQALLARLGIIAVYLAQHLEHVAAFAGKVRYHFHELPARRPCSRPHAGHQ